MTVLEEVLMLGQGRLGGWVGRAGICMSCARLIVLR